MPKKESKKEEQKAPEKKEQREKLPEDEDVIFIGKTNEETGKGNVRFFTGVIDLLFYTKGIRKITLKTRGQANIGKTVDILEFTKGKYGGEKSIIKLKEPIIKTSTHIWEDKTGKSRKVSEMEVVLEKK